MPLLKRIRKPEMPELSLNITSLLDVLTVLLFFLIKSYAVSSNALTPPDGIRLPASAVKLPMEEAVTISINQNQIIGNNMVLAKLQNGRFDPREIGSDKRTVLPVKSFLISELKKRNSLYKGQGDLSFLPDATVLIQGDKALHFSTLKYLFHTIAVSGYNDYQFVVLTKD